MYAKKGRPEMQEIKITPEIVQNWVLEAQELNEKLNEVIMGYKNFNESHEQLGADSFQFFQELIEHGKVHIDKLESALEYFQYFSRLFEESIKYISEPEKPLIELADRFK